MTRRATISGVDATSRRLDCPPGAADATGPVSHTLGVPARHLTPREQDVLRLVGLGCSNKGVADRLGVSVQTVKNHMTVVLEKLDVESRVEAFRAVGWLKVPGEPLRVGRV